MALSSFYDTMGDGDDNVMHGTPEEAHEVSDKLFDRSTLCAQLCVNYIEADISLHVSLRLKSWVLYNSISVKLNCELLNKAIPRSTLRLDLPQVDLVNFGVEYVQSGRF